MNAQELKYKLSHKTENPDNSLDQSSKHIGWASWSSKRSIWRQEVLISCSTSRAHLLGSSLGRATIRCFRTKFHTYHILPITSTYHLLKFKLLWNLHRTLRFLSYPTIFIIFISKPKRCFKFATFLTNLIVRISN